MDCWGRRACWSDRSVYGRAAGSGNHLADRRIGAIHRSRRLWRNARPPFMGWRGRNPATRAEDRPIRVLRLLSIDRQREVLFDDRFSEFEPLMRLVETKIRHVGAGAPSSWGRPLWSQSRGRRAEPADRRYVSSADFCLRCVQFGTYSGVQVWTDLAGRAVYPG
jgi:hypothetical protein